MQIRYHLDESVAHAIGQIVLSLAWLWRSKTAEEMLGVVVFL